MAAKKNKTSDLLSQADSGAPLDGAALLRAAAPVLKLLDKDLLSRADGSPGVTAALKERHAAEKKAERTADNFATWRRAFVEQVAAAWFLSVVFVRTLEDRGLIERNRIAGEGALDSQKSFFALAPSLSERDYLLTVFKELSHVPAAADLFDARHNPVWLLGPSAEAAQALLALFRLASDTEPAFRFGGDTRFLGDLYQDLSENVRKRYALLQTPRFVESYILDKTLEPAIEKFGLEDATLIDPTCGSGHFLLGAFERLLDHRLAREPGVDVRQAALKAVGAVAGTDINAYAVSIARFRLTLAFLERAGYARLKDAPQLPIHLAVADSLLHNPQKGLESKGPEKGKTSDLFAQTLLGEQQGQDLAAWEGELFALEDPQATADVLGTAEKPKRYAAVVGNPPYITVKDAVLRERYRAMYASAFRSYSLAVPFKERFFQLGRHGAYVGMITANSFMKREFGKVVIEQYLPSVNLTSIVNTSGAYIPGHGTPTVLLFGTAERPKKETVHTVLASRGEPSTPADPEQGLVWRSIADHGQELGFENDYVSVTETERSALAQHPWSLGGGGATELKALLEERAEKTLGDVVDVIGFGAVTREDEVFLLGDRATLERWHVPPAQQRRLMAGESVRDWSIPQEPDAIWPYDPETLEPVDDPKVTNALWPWRTQLAGRVAYGKTQLERGLPWFAYSMFFTERFRTPLTITFAFVATHNHFVLDRGGKVFKQSAPIIKLPESATEDDHYALLAYLNSSTACFWMKQVMFKKYSANQKHNSDISRIKYEFAGEALKELPIPHLSEQQRQLLVRAARQADHLANEQQSLLSDHADAPQEIFSHWDAVQARLVPLQEEIDWIVYEAFGLCGSSVYDLDLPPVPAGGRPFELETGHHQGFTERIGVQNTMVSRSEVPKSWLERAEKLKGQVRFIETPEFKRTWRFSDENKHPTEVRADLASKWQDESVLGVMEAEFRERSTVAAAPNTRAGVLAADNAVPFLTACTYRETGLEKRAAWEKTWEAQRAEDRGEPATPEVPPQYSQGSRGQSTDFRQASYWRLRGKLDVPKERFISYPGCESDEDGEPVYGWAGWDHRQRAVALATLYGQRKNEEGWPKERLQPMLAGLLELLPWLEQWHNQPDAAFDGAIPAAQFRDFLDAECAEHGFTFEDLRAWRPPEKSRASKATKKKTAKKSSTKDKAATKESEEGS